MLVPVPVVDVDADVDVDTMDSDGGDEPDWRADIDASCWRERAVELWSVAVVVGGSWKESSSKIEVRDGDDTRLDAMVDMVA